MAVYAGPLVDQVLRRVRDPAGKATPVPVVLELLTEAQRYIVLRYNAVIHKTNFTLKERRALYTFLDLSYPAEDIAKVVGIRLDNRDLVFEPWRSMIQSDSFWTKRTAAVPHSWSIVGRNLIAVYPVPSQEVPVEIRYVPTAPPLDDPSSEILLPTEHQDELLDLTEALVLIRMRRFPQALIALSRAGVKVDG